MPNTVSRRRQATRQRLMDAAVELFAERGVLASPVEEICDRAGFTRGAFYSNFDSRDELCLAVIRRQADESLAATQQATATLAGPSSATLDELVERAVGVFIEAQPTDASWLLAHSELRLYAARNPAMRGAVSTLKDRVTDAVKSVISDALDRVGARLTVPVDQAVDALYAVFEHSALTALIEGRRSPADARGDQLVAVLRAMIDTVPAPAQD